MRILIPFSHRIRILHFFALFRIFRIFPIFALFVHILRIFLTLFATFWCINREISTEKVESAKMRKSVMRMRNAMRKKCDAIRSAFSKSANAKRKSFRTTIPAKITISFSVSNEEAVGLLEKKDITATHLHSALLEQPQPAAAASRTPEHRPPEQTGEPRCDAAAASEKTPCPTNPSASPA
jgi:hypothetical protein